jgi:hypothetical protein
LSARPRTSADPKSFVQSAWPITATGVPSGIESSSARKYRPSAGAASKKPKSEALTPATFRTRTSSPPPPTPKRHSDTAATSASVPDARRRSRKRAYGNVVFALVRPWYVVSMYTRFTVAGSRMPGNGRNITRSMTPNIAAFAPIPSPSVSTAARVKPGERRSPRSA